MDPDVLIAIEDISVIDVTTVERQEKSNVSFLFTSPLVQVLEWALLDAIDRPM